MKYPPDTERLQYRLWTMNDEQLAQNLWGNEEVTHLIDARGKLTVEEVREKLLGELKSAQDHGVQYWPIFLKTGEHVGCAGLRAHKPAQRIFELGFHLIPEFWGRGLASEAARGVMRFAFEELEVAALFAGHNPQNSASRHMLIKLGFQSAGEAFYEPTGLMHPSYLLRASDWPRM